MRRRLRFDRFPDECRSIRAVELVDGDDPGGGGDVDLGQHAADHVDADEQQATPLELGAERFANLALSVGQLSGFRRAARREVRSELALARHPVDGARHLAIDQHDALVAFGHCGEEGLGNERLFPDRPEQFRQRGQVRPVRPDPEYAFPRFAMQRLDHNLAVSGVEGTYVGKTAADHRRRHEAREIEHEQLFGRIADGARIVHYQRLARNPFEQVSGRDVADVERRVLPHQDDIDVARKIECDGFARVEMVAFDPLDRNWPGLGADAPALIGQVPGEIMKQPMPARLRTQH